MNKKCVIIKDLNGKPLQILDFKTFTCPADYLAFEKECEENHREFVAELKAKDERIAQLENALRLVQLELAYNRGDLTEEEYENAINK